MPVAPGGSGGLEYDRAVNRKATIRSAVVLAGALPFISWSLSQFSDAARLLAPWFQLQCHGRLDRTLALSGRYFPVCSRCLGIYAGLLVAGVVARPLLSASARRGWLLAAAALMVLEVYVQDTTGHRPYHALRLLTGMLLAWPVALTLIAAATSTTSPSLPGEVDR
jgi:uncharacterized membrane protein